MTSPKLVTPARVTPDALRGLLGAAAAVLTLVAWAFGAPQPAASHTRITTNITWSGEIRTILRRRCMRCHSPGGIAPDYADFTTYGTDSKPGARAWATAIEEEILTGRMPPWDADPRYGSFANARTLTRTEVDLIVAWVQGGAPQGPKRNLPAPAEYQGGGWQLGEPDIVLQPQDAYTLKGGQDTGSVRHQLAIEIEKDTWITGFEFRPESHTSVERMAAWILDPEDAQPESLELEIQVPYDPFRDEDEPEPTRFRAMPRGRRFLGQWLRGDDPVLFPEGAGKRLRRGSTLELLIVYRRHDLEGGDEEVVDRSRVGLVLAQTEDEVDLITESTKLGGEPVTVTSKLLKKPVVTSTVLQENLRLVGLNPDLGEGVSRLEVIAHYPDQRQQTLLYLPDYRAEWPASFVFSEPLDAPIGTRIEMIASFGPDAEDSEQAFAMEVDYTLDDHLVLPEVIRPQARPGGTRGGMLISLFDNPAGGSGANVGADPPATNPADPNAAAHMDHSPLHGGQFFMAPNMYHHLEGALPKEGDFYLYVYDDFKQPLDPRNFGGQVIFERYDEKSGDFAEEKYPLEAVAGTEYLRATISPEMPSEFFASVWLAGKNRRFDFYFDELSKELPPSARSAATAAAGNHSHDRPAMTIPQDARGIVTLLVEKLRRLNGKIEGGDWVKLYVPAFDGRDLAEALLEKLDGLSVRGRGKVRKAISRVMQSAGELDRAGDLADAARVRQATDRFESGVRDMVDVILGSN